MIPFINLILLVLMIQVINSLVKESINKINNLQTILLFLNKTLINKTSINKALINKIILLDLNLLIILSNKPINKIILLYFKLIIILTLIN